MQISFGCKTRKLCEVWQRRTAFFNGAVLLIPSPSVCRRGCVNGVDVYAVRVLETMAATLTADQEVVSAISTYYLDVSLP